MEIKKDRGECPVEISDNDIFSAMKRLTGYIDITPADFKEIYQIAYHHAVDRIYKDFKAIDIMSHPVKYVQADTSLLETAVLMADNNISGIPVVDSDNYVLGVISEKDFLGEMSGQAHQSFMGVVAHCLSNRGCIAVTLRNQLARDIMSTPPICVKQETAMVQIAEIFESRNINRVPVLDLQMRLTGIVTRSDLVRHFCTLSE